MKTTWKAPSSGHGTLDADDRNKLPDSAYAFPDKRKEPLTDARHVQTALARFDQVQDVSDTERDQAFANIKAAAKHFGVDVAEDSWKQLGTKPHTKIPVELIRKGLPPIIGDGNGLTDAVYVDDVAFWPWGY